jgi:hypothetical protein
MMQLSLRPRQTGLRLLVIRRRPPLLGSSSWTEGTRLFSRLVTTQLKDLGGLDKVSYTRGVGGLVFHTGNLVKLS